MKCFLYIPPFGCEGTKVNNISEIRIGGLTLVQRACRSIQKAEFDEIIIIKPDTVMIPNDEKIKIPIQKHDYETRAKEIAPILAELIPDEPCAFCTLDGMISPECLKMRPQGADVRITAGDAQTGIYFMSAKTLKSIFTSEDCLFGLPSEITETFLAPPKALYHRIVSAEDIKIGRDKLTQSLRKPLGRDADGLVAYFINRPCSLRISKHLANTPITPNMVTAFGLILGLAAAPLVATGDPWLMALAVFLWQTSSMVDGIDGELARMRMSPSHSGEWFDTVADDITNIAFLAGLGYGIGQISNNPLYFYIAACICGMMVISCSWFYREFVKMGIASHNHFEWGFEAENKENKENEHRNPIRKALDLIAGGFAWIAKRDFYTFLIMCLVMAGACFSPLYYAAYFIMLIGASFVGIGGISALTLRAIRNRKK